MWKRRTGVPLGSAGRVLTTADARAVATQFCVNMPHEGAVGWYRQGYATKGARTHLFDTIAADLAKHPDVSADGR